MTSFSSGSALAVLVVSVLSGCTWSTDTSCEDLKACDVTDAAAAGGVGGNRTTQTGLGGARSGGASSTGGLPALGGTHAVGGGSLIGGARAGGGAQPTGAALAFGGTLAFGGAPATGGMPATGGLLATGGAPTCTPACSGVKPVCDLSRLSCVECLSDTECPSGKPKCKTREAADAGAELNICVACITSSDCRQTSAPVCNAANNTCVGCVSSTDCTNSAVPVCDTSIKTCVGCVANTDCKDAAQPTCDPSTKACVGCVANTDCKNPTVPVCDASTKTCVGCLNSTDCKNPAVPVCDTSTKTCVGCLGSSDCKDPAVPVCDTSTKTCVGCLGSSDCKDSAKPLCNTATKSCVTCLSNSDCRTPGASKCDVQADSPTENTCIACSVNSDCAHVTGREICKTNEDADADPAADAGTGSGVCVQCTVENEAACAGNSCNPASNECTSTVRGSRKTCQSCVADSECGTNAGVVDPNSRCVPMTFAGAAHGNDGYCLQTVAPGCSRPYAVSFTAASVSGAPAEAYCGINQSATTCEAVLDLASAKTCTMDADCGGGEGGLCKAISVVAPANRCTIPCGTDAQCPSGNTCSGTTNGWCQ